MIKIKLPDNSIMEMEEPVCGLDIAQKISERLALAAFAVTVDGKLTDLKTPITTEWNSAFQIMLTVLKSREIY